MADSRENVVKLYLSDDEKLAFFRLVDEVSKRTRTPQSSSNVGRMAIGYLAEQLRQSWPGSTGRTLPDALAANTGGAASGDE